jgi:sulfatase maturation enzyme AslB (radical SAM superfamily)
MNAQTILKRGTFWELFKLMVRQRHVRRKALGIIEARTYKAFVEDNPDNLPRHVQESKYEHLVALLHGFDRAVEHGLISKHVINRLLDVFLKNIILGGEEVKKAADSLGFNPPMFLLVSPTGRCNLRCKGCYAESDPGNHASLDFDTFDRILTEKRELWGSHFTVISGGEPFLWRDHGRDLLDMVEKHDTDFFMVYTNSTLITEEVAARMAELGNITPAISVEGFEKETDARRGRGVYKKILTAFENLRTHGVPFGVSTTPTTNNWEVITSERFVDFYFEREGALYGWLFQYMPIGRGQSLELMVKPEERVQMLKRMRQQVRERKVLLADFWNSGPVSN